MLFPLTVPKIGPVFGPLGMLLSVSVPRRHSPSCWTSRRWRERRRVRRPGSRDEHRRHGRAGAARQQHHPRAKSHNSSSVVEALPCTARYLVNCG
jgi:hypothetical protein